MGANRLFGFDSEQWRYLNDKITRKIILWASWKDLHEYPIQKSLFNWKSNFGLDFYERKYEWIIY